MILYHVKYLRQRCRATKDFESSFCPLYLCYKALSAHAMNLSFCGREWRRC